MSEVIRSTTSAILLAVQARLRYYLDTRLTLLAQAAVLPSEAIAVCIAEPEDVPHYTAARELLIAPQEEESDDDSSTGGGRVHTQCYRTFHVVCRSRLDLDQVGQDVARLTDASLGHLALEHGVKDALHIWMPTGVSAVTSDVDDILVEYPIHWRRTSRTRPDRGDRSWVSSTLVFEVGYTDALNQDDQ